MSAASRALLALVVLVARPGSPRAEAEPFQTLARDLVGADQGVFVRAEDGTVLAALNADRAVHPASVTKVATTLALLRRLGPSYRFETRLLAGGPLRDGVVHGDLVVEGGRDPALVFESAFLVLRELHDRGLVRVDGGLRVRGPLLFNWAPDPRGERLRRTLEGRDGAEAWAAVAAARGDGTGSTPRAVAITFAGRRVSGSAEGRQLVVLRSPPLRRIVKALNCYSNNVFHLLAEHIGGPAVVEQIARESVPAPARPAIVIDNAAGAGTANRLSPRAAVELLAVLDAELARRELSLVDVLPVAGIDPGTLRERLNDPSSLGAVVGKTGTFGSLGASALAGVARTPRYGRVAFAILNCDVPVPEAQRRQNAFVEAILREAGAVPWAYRRNDDPLFVDASLESAE